MKSFIFICILAAMSYLYWYQQTKPPIVNPDVPSNCIMMSDGCNTCFAENGKLFGCTKLICETAKEPECTKYQE